MQSGFDWRAVDSLSDAAPEGFKAISGGSHLFSYE
jgi:hypothetical protein